MLDGGFQLKLVSILIAIATQKVRLISLIHTQAYYLECASNEQYHQAISYIANVILIVQRMRKCNSFGV